MHLDLDRLDIHMGDYVRPLNIEIEDRLLLSDLLRGTLVPYVPTIAEGWTFRALTNDGPIDIATSGGSNRSPQLLVEDTPVVLLGRGGTLRIGARPTKPDVD